jgi:hypothetical protein
VGLRSYVNSKAWEWLKEGIELGSYQTFRERFGGTLESYKVVVRYLWV